MLKNMNETQLKAQILDMVEEYCRLFHNKKKEFQPGDRITYASRSYGCEEMRNLVDARHMKNIVKYKASTTGRTPPASNPGFAPPPCPRSSC